MSDIQARIDSLLIAKQALEHEIAWLQQQVETAASSPGAAAAWRPDWGSVGDAQTLLNCSRVTALQKIKLHGLGHVVDRRWHVDLNRVRAHLARTPFPPLSGAN